LSSVDFTNRFKIYILQSGISQNELARRVGITYDHMNHIISGRLKGRKYRTKICEIIGIKITDLWEPEFCKKCGQELKSNGN
jgi:DNA-binding Xre family transcriptional regulator